MNRLSPSHVASTATQHNDQHQLGSTNNITKTGDNQQVSDFSSRNR